MNKCNLCPTKCNKGTVSFLNCQKRIKTNYEHFCNEYLRLFCQKHDFDYEDAHASWVRNDVGGIACCEDFFFNMDVIRTDIDEAADAEELMKWYDYSLRCSMLGIPGCNFHSWLHRCPIRSEEELAKLEQLQKKVEKAKEELEKAIREDKDKF